MIDGTSAVDGRSMSLEDAAAEMCVAINADSY
jgi:hypothetical protein